MVLFDTMSFIENNLKLENTKCILCEEKIPFSDDGVMMCEEYYRHQVWYGGGFSHISEYVEIDWVCLKCFDNNAKEIIIKKNIEKFDYLTRTYSPEIKIETFEKCICGKGIKQNCLGNGCWSDARVCLGCETKTSSNLEWCKECDIDDDDYLSDGR